MNFVEWPFLPSQNLTPIVCYILIFILQHQTNTFKTKQCAQKKNTEKKKKVTHKICMVNVRWADVISDHTRLVCPAELNRVCVKFSACSIQFKQLHPEVCILTKAEKNYSIAQNWMHPTYDYSLVYSLKKSVHWIK